MSIILWSCVCFWLGLLDEAIHYFLWWDWWIGSCSLQQARPDTQVRLTWLQSDLCSVWQWSTSIVVCFIILSYVCNLRSGNYRIVKHLMQLACKSARNWLRNHIYFPSYMHTKWSAINKTLNCTSQVWRAVVKVSSSFTFPHMACLHLLLLLLSLPIGGPMFYETARTVQNNWQCSCDFGRNWLIVGASHCVHICLFIWRWAAIAMEIRNSNFPSELDHFNTNCRRGSFLLMQPQLAVNPCRNGCRQWNICKWNVLLEFWTKAHSWAYSWVYRCFPLSAMLGK